jgi:hypothetical protein
MPSPICFTPWAGPQGVNPLWRALTIPYPLQNLALVSQKQESPPTATQASFWRALNRQSTVSKQRHYLGRHALAIPHLLQILALVSQKIECVPRATQASPGVHSADRIRSPLKADEPQETPSSDSRRFSRSLFVRVCRNRVSRTGVPKRESGNEVTRSRGWAAGNAIVRFMPFHSVRVRQGLRNSHCAKIKQFPGTTSTSCWPDKTRAHRRDSAFMSSGFSNSIATSMACVTIQQVVLQSMVSFLPRNFYARCGEV